MDVVEENYASFSGVKSAVASKDSPYGDIDDLDPVYSNAFGEEAVSKTTATIVPLTTLTWTTRTPTHLPV